MVLIMCWNSLDIHLIRPHGNYRAAIIPILHPSKLNHKYSFCNTKPPASRLLTSLKRRTHPF